MAGGVNKVIIIGNLGAKPDLKYLPSGQAVCEMRLATTDSYNDKQGVRQDRTEWHRVVCWGKTAENAGKYLDKGRQVYVEGRLQTRSWDDKDGNKRYTTEVVANQVVFLGGGGAGAGAGGERGERPASASTREAPSARGSGDSATGEGRNQGDGAPPDFGGGPGPADEDIPF